MEQEAMLATIRDAPDDLTARLVYADWLDEHDDPLGGYVRAECAPRAAAPGTPELIAALALMRAIVESIGAVFGGWEYAPEVTRLSSLRDEAPGEFQLGPTVPEAELLAFESRHGLLLPGPFRAFLLRVGNGWTDGSDTGLLRFDPGADLRHLRTPFPYSQADAQAALVVLRDWSRLTGFHPPPDWTQGRGRSWDGCLAVAELGCGINEILVVNGDVCGQVWVHGDVYGPCADDGFTHALGFFEWFERVYAAAEW